MNSTQLKHFRSLLAKKRSLLLDKFYYDKDIDKPEEVLQAEKVIEAWKEKNRAGKSAIYQQVEEELLSLETKCVFGAEHQDILEALQALDSWQPS